MISADDVINGMLEIEPKGGDDGFRKIKETLTRMGVPNREHNVLNQSAHILHRRGQYYICHFKELFALDGLRTDFDDSDKARRNRIAQMLEDWGLIEVLKKDQMQPMAHPSAVKVIRHSEKDQWTLQPKYTIGVKKEIRK